MKGAILIFTELAEKIEPVVNRSRAIFEKLRNCQRKFKICAFLCLSMFAIIFSFMATDVRLAYKVDMGGKVIATVKDKAQFENAVNVVEKKTAVNLEDNIGEVKYHAAWVRTDVIDNDATVVEAIMERSEDIVTASALYIDGIEYSRVKGIDVNKYLEDYKNSFILSDVENEVYFNERITVKEDYFAASSIDDIEIFEQIVRDNTTVVTVACASESYAIPFKTVTQKTSSKLVGYSNVDVAGSDGVGSKRVRTIYVNGEALFTEVLEDIVLAEPVNKVVTVGTGKKTASAAELSYAQSSGFIFPLPNGSWTVSAYYGDGRNHKGLDLAAKRGVSIFAVKGGTVTYAGWKGGYGYFVEIDHGNGLKTRYGHASKLCVSKGETVAQGTVIAQVGSTGNSTGNHLHFEVVKNGVNYNPGPYVGLR